MLLFAPSVLLQRARSFWLQVIVVGFVAASVGVFESVIITSSILGAYIGLAYVVFLVITWAVHGYYLPIWARRSGYVVAAVVVAGGLILSLYEYFAEKRSDLAIIFFSLAYWVITISLFAAGVTRLATVGAFSSAADIGAGDVLQASRPTFSGTGDVVQVSTRALPAGSNPTADATTMIISNPNALASYSPTPRIYHSALLFPAFRSDAGSGLLAIEHQGPALVWSALVMALIWGTLAMVFIVPFWAGVMVTNIVKLAASLYASDAIRRSSSELLRSVSLLLEAEPVDGAPSAPSLPRAGARTNPRSGAAPISPGEVYHDNPLRPPLSHRLSEAVDTSVVPPSAKVRTDGVAFLAGCTCLL